MDKRERNEMNEEIEESVNNGVQVTGDVYKRQWHDYMMNIF